MEDTDSSTRWTIILGAAEGKPLDRAEFARRYEDAIRSYLGARWRRGVLRGEMDDAVQDVFVECLKDEGALSKVDPDRAGGFRAFLYGVTRNVARRHESKRREVQPPSSFEQPAEDVSLATTFDRAWAQSILRQAGELQAERAQGNATALRRVELLRLRFGEGQPMREIAAAWKTESQKLQYDYAKARREFEAALYEVVRRHSPRGPVDEEAARLLALLG